MAAERPQLHICYRTVTVWTVAFVLLAGIGCTSDKFASVRKTAHNPLSAPLKLLSRDGPSVTPRTRQSLRQLDLERYAEGNYEEGLEELSQQIAQEPTPDKLYTYAELSYVAATRAKALGQSATALELYAASVSHAYLYLFECAEGIQADGYDPRFRQACDIYNESLEGALRLVKSKGHLQQGSTYLIKTPNHQFQVSVETVGRWKDTQFQDFKFCSDYEVTDLKNQHRQFGLGVPLIAECKDQPPRAAGAEYFPPNVTFALTAFVQVTPQKKVDPRTNQLTHNCRIFLYDPLETPEIEIHGKNVPLEADISTPLAYLLDGRSYQSAVLATMGLLNPGESRNMSGVYMLEPYDPRKIPVMMVHGLWSSPMTWLEMFNDLRAQPEIRENYQFWFYLYPTGQPFWISAAQFRKDLKNMRNDLDPQHAALALDQMVLVGHSMGGLVSRMQTIDSRNDFWNLVSDQPPALLKGNPEDAEALKEVLFFEPNRSVRRVITMGTPHRGSQFANSATRFLGRSLIMLPSMVKDSGDRLLAANPGLFRDKELLEINTSIDSLDPNSPVLPAILQAKKAPWVKYHTVVGVLDEDTWLGYFSAHGDGVVEYESARLDEATSELVVTADHNTVHRNPKSVLEVRRVLREHVNELRQEYFSQTAPNFHPTPTPNYDVRPASYKAPVVRNHNVSRYSASPSSN